MKYIIIDYSSEIKEICGVMDFWTANEFIKHQNGKNLVKKKNGEFESGEFRAVPIRVGVPWSIIA